MSDIFEPQMTTQGTFRETETNLYDRLRKFGYEHPVAEAIAHSFTKYMLGYLTVEGVAQEILGGGADRDTARKFARMFEQVRQPDAHIIDKRRLDYSRTGTHS